MNLEILAALFFTAVFVLLLSGSFLLLESPERRRLKRRLAALQETRVREMPQDESVVKEITRFERAVLNLPLASRYHAWVEQAGLRTSGVWVLSVSTALGVLGLVLGVALRLPNLLVPALVIAGASIPFLYVAYRRHTRLRRFEEIFPEAMDMLARAVRAGYAFTMGLELIAKELPDPVAREFQITYDQQNLGLPLRDALQNLAVRVPLDDVRIFVVLLQIQQESGGNLADMLDNLSNVVRERFKLFRQVRVYTAEGRLSMVVLTALPPLAAMLFLFTNPAYIEPLFNDPLGHQMVAVGILMQVVGFLVIRRIVQPRF